MIAFAVLSAGVLTGAGGLYVLSEHLTDNVGRTPSVFGPLDPEKRPVKPPGPGGQGMTILLAGSDSLASDPAAGAGGDTHVFVPGAERSDVIMLVRLDVTRTRAAVVSIPRDSWVSVPGHGQTKINAAFSYGGPTLMVQTIEALTGVRIDHFATVDFAGFRAMVDAVGGIDVMVAAPTSTGDVHFHKGSNHLNGRETLAYVRQRYDLPRGDLDRVRRQQNVLRALMTKAATGGTLSDPVGLYHLLDAVSTSVGIDDTLDDDELRTFLYGLRSLTAGEVTFLTAPVSGLGREGSQSVVHLDPVRAALLWRSLDSDDIASYARNNGPDVLSAEPR
jgi:LCP family protein required for cell wall assembly